MKHSSSCLIYYFITNTISENKRVWQIVYLRNTPVKCKYPITALTMACAVQLLWHDVYTVLFNGLMMAADSQSDSTICYSYDYVYYPSSDFHKLAFTPKTECGKRVSYYQFTVDWMSFPAILRKPMPCTIFKKNITRL